MVLHEIFVLAFVSCILIVQFSAVRLHIDEEKDNDDESRLLKRFLFSKSTAASTQRTPSVLENLIRPSSTRSSTPRSSIWTQKSTYSPSGPCVSNPCEHGGICTPKGQMTYDCQCIGPWRGIYCGIGDACYRSPCQNGGTCLNVHDDYWCKCTSDYYGTNCQTKFYSSSYSENNCRPNTCNTGRCVSLKTTYYCQCPDDRYGEHCEKRFSKRIVSNLDLYYNLLHQMRRGMVKQDTKDIGKFQKEENVAYYDVKNKIYF